MIHPHRHPARILACGIAAAAQALFLSLPAHAATSVQTLVAQAVKDTNTVTTLVHHDQFKIVYPTLTVAFTASGNEDEVHNREQDHEDVNVTAKGKNGKTKKLHYTADVIFMNNKTYYRVSVANNTWHTGKGMVFHDPYTQGFQRARTTISFPKGIGTFTQVGTSNGETEVRATFKNKQESGNIELWISSGSHPYVVRETLFDSSTQVKGVSTTFSSTLGPFDKPVVIVPPTSGGST